jgi:hypothetical protein
MRRILHILLIIGILAGTLTLSTSTSQGAPFRRGGFRGVGWGRAYYGPGWGYRGVYRPFGYGWGGYGWGSRGYGWGYGGYPVYGVGYPVGYSYGYPVGYSWGYPGGSSWGYPGVYGTSISIGSPLGGFTVGSYPY